MPISDSVGRGGANQRDDVRFIQTLLNLLPSGPSPTLAVDGACGPMTLAAIEAAERAHLEHSAVTGCIVPDSPLFRRLRAALPAGLTVATLPLALLGARPEDVAELGPTLLAAMTTGAITSARAQAHFVAQIAHESGCLRHREEIASGADYEGRADLGNTQPGDGVRFKGRGLIQLTGRANYRDYGEAIGIDLTRDGNWSRVASDPALAVGCAIWFWNRNGLSALAEADDLEAVTRRINGGLNGLADRAAHLRRAAFLLPVAEAPTATPAFRFATQPRVSAYR